MAKRIIFLTALALAFVACSATAQAAGQIAIYQVRTLPTTSTGIVWGQVLGETGHCTANRRFKLLIRSEEGGKPEILDRGQASQEGALSGLYPLREVRDAFGSYLVAPATKQCAALKQSIGDLAPANRRSSRSRWVETQIGVANANGIDEDGAIGGIIILSPRRNCFEGRRIEMSGDGTFLDKGSTTRNGSWALHITHDELESIGHYKVKVAKSKSGKDRCSGASIRFKLD